MKTIIALFLVFAMCFSFVACGGDAQDEKICLVCMEKYVGEWFYISDVETPYFDGDERILQTLVIAEDGTIVIEGVEYYIDFECHEGYHYAIMCDENGVMVDDISNNFVLEKDVEKQGIYVNNKLYRPISEYTIVEITEENWRDYFSENFSEHFTKSYELKLVTNEWEEVQEGYVEKIYTLKDKEKYSYATELTMEISFTKQSEYYEFDLSKKTITNCIVGKKEDKIYKTTHFTYYPYMQVQIGSTHLYSDEIRSGQTLEENMVTEPQEILRMKGWLVIKND